MSLAVLAGAAWVIANRQEVVDQVRLLTYTPTAEARQLADNDQLQDHGRKLLYVSEPAVQDRAAFNKSCTSNEKTIVLGCYKSQRIYLYNITDARFSGVKEVTAAHEMLHAAYERMSDAERRDVDAMLKPIVEGMTDKRILELIDLYNKSEPGELYNEMHSILGTEYGTLTPELETYYQKYFKNRKVVVGFASQYQAIFTESKNKIDDYDRQLGELKPRIESNNAALQNAQSELQAENDRLAQYRAKGQIEQYNQGVSPYNAKVAAFNALIEETRRLVEQYNSMVEERNNQVAAQDDLYQSIDSNYQTVQRQ